MHVSGHGDMFGEFSVEVLLYAQGQPRQLVNHEIWSGTLSANGKTVVEHAAQTDHFFANGGSSNSEQSMTKPLQAAC